MLRSIEFHTRVSVWQQTQDAQRGRNAPQPIPLTQAERAETMGETFDAMTVDEARDWLGWSDKVVPSSATEVTEGATHGC